MTIWSRFRKRRKKPIWIYLDVRGDDASKTDETSIKTPTSVAMSDTYVVKTPTVEQIVEQSSESSNSAAETSRESSAGPIRDQCYKTFSVRD
jgi:hypothetical protein